MLFLAKLVLALLFLYCLVLLAILAGAYVLKPVEWFLSLMRSLRTRAVNRR